MWSLFLLFIGVKGGHNPKMHSAMKYAYSSDQLDGVVGII